MWIPPQAGWYHQELYIIRFFNPVYQIKEGDLNQGGWFRALKRWTKRCDSERGGQHGKRGSGNGTDLGKTMATGSECFTSWSQEWVISPFPLHPVTYRKQLCPSASNLAFSFIPIQEHYFRTWHLTLRVRKPAFPQKEAGF